MIHLDGFQHNVLLNLGVSDIIPAEHWIDILGAVVKFPSLVLCQWVSAFDVITISHLYLFNYLWIIAIYQQLNRHGLRIGIYERKCILLL